MNVLLRCNVIVAACDALIKEIEAERARINEQRRLETDRWNKHWWGKHFKIHKFIGSQLYLEQRTRAGNLKAIAKHKMGDGVLIVHDPHLSDIAAYLPPYVSERV